MRDEMIKRLGFARVSVSLPRFVIPKLTVANVEGFRAPVGVRKSYMYDPRGLRRWAMGISDLGR